jgi:cytochrome c5
MVYVVEERNHRVQVFDLTGSVKASFGEYQDLKNSPEQDPYGLNNPLGIAISEDTILVVDYGNNRIIGYDKDGSNDFKPRWISHNNEPGFGWYGPYYAEYLPQRGQFVIVNRGNNELGLLTRDGKRVKVFGSQVLNFPHEVAFDKTENLYVADMKNHQLVKFSNASDYETHEVIKFPESYGLPKTVAIDEEDNIFVGFVANGTAYFLLLVQSNKPVITEISMLEPIKPLFTVKSEVSGGTPSTATAIYQRFCASCHEGGRYDAPARGNIEAWERFPRDLDLLVDLAIEGKGAMIPRGGCTECSPDDLKSVIEYMLPVTWKLSVTGG